MRNTVGNNPDAVQLWQPDEPPDRADAVLTLQLREIGAWLSSDQHDPATDPRHLPDDEVASPE